MTMQQDERLRDLEQQRAQWQEEVRQVRDEEEQKYFHIEKKLMPLIALVVPCCFIVYFFYGIFLQSIGRWFMVLWTGSIVVMLRYSYKLNHLVDKFCIGLLLCSISAMVFNILGNAHLLVGSTAQVCVVLHKIACIAGVVCSIYPIKMFWINRKQVNEMDVINPYRWDR